MPVGAPCTFQTWSVGVGGGVGRGVVVWLTIPLNPLTYNHSYLRMNVVASLDCEQIVGCCNLIVSLLLAAVNERVVWNTKYHVKANALHLLCIIWEGKGVGMHKACAPLGLGSDMVGPFAFSDVGLAPLFGVNS